MNIVLIGNQNCGKTTLFNHLTGANQHVGNFPGVTVDAKGGALRGHKNVTVIDLPGIYSLSPYSSEEIVTRDALLKGKPDGIINIIDATNIERNLYLTLQVLQMQIPMVVALNMMDEVRANHGAINTEILSETLGVPVVPISAANDDGLEDLCTAVLKTIKNRSLPKEQDFCGGAVHRALHAIAHIVEDHAQRAGISPRFAAEKLLERDAPISEQLILSENEEELIEHAVLEMESELATDRKAAIADMRYTYIETLCAKAVKKPEKNRALLRSLKMDNVLTHRFFGIPIFFGIMFLIFYLTFGLIGPLLSEFLSGGIDYLSGVVQTALQSYGMNETVISLIVDGIFAGVGAVLSFLPTILVLFFFLSELEDSGYMARVAFVMDKLLRRIGLSGKSIVPLLIGFGCTVPAVMATRTLSSERDRKMTIFLTPFMSCSAKLPIYSVFSIAFFPNHSALVMIILYLTGVLLAVLFGLLFKKTIFRGEPIPFVMELPNYRFPSPKSVLLLLWEKARDFITRAFTVIFLASIVVWFLQTFDLRLNIAADSSSSILYAIGAFVAPVFAPLGFGDPRIVTALMTGFAAKEAVVSTLSILTGSARAALPAALSSLFTPISACAFLIFCLLYTPCVAAVAVVKKELGGVRSMLSLIVFQTGIAWVLSFLFVQIAALF